jgi:hypothetical protein
MLFFLLLRVRKSLKRRCEVWIEKDSSLDCMYVSVVVVDKVSQEGMKEVV